MSSARLTVRITCPTILKSSSPSRASLVTYSLYKFSRIGKKKKKEISVHDVIIENISSNQQVDTLTLPQNVRHLLTCLS